MVATRCLLVPIKEAFCVFGVCDCASTLTCNNCRGTTKLDTPVASIHQQFAFGAFGSVAWRLASSGLPACRSICLYLFVSLPLSLSVCLFLSVCLPFWLPAYLAVRLFLSLSVSPSHTDSAQECILGPVGLPCLTQVWVASRSASWGRWAYHASQRDG